MTSTSDAGIAGDMVPIAGGTFRMGSDHFYPEEAPQRLVTIDSFLIDRFPVTNTDFARFVDATGYLTVAERPLERDRYPGADPELLVPGSLVFHMTPGPVDLDDVTNWWSYVPGANWRHPLGPASDLDGLGDHPVVHIAHDDALAFARWRGVDLPSETEWEYAARGGLDGADFCWGDESTPNGRHLANTWQGRFPWQNLELDGYPGTSPVGSFPPNGYGLHDMAGNVWEWTSDWWQIRAHHNDGCCTPVDPRGGTEAGSLDPTAPDETFGRKVIKGGSHLCAPNYCLRYRPAARQPESIDTATCHIGFRCVRHEPLP